MTYIVPILSALVGAGLFSFIEFLITRKDKTSKQLEEIKAKQDEIQLSMCRLQLLNLIQHEGSQHELMLVAEKYFKDLGGDWYMTPIFCRWLDQHNIPKPAWFKGGSNE